MVKLVGRDKKGDVTVAAYIFIYDDAPKTEEWNVELPWAEDCVQVQI